MINAESKPAAEPRRRRPIAGFVMLGLLALGFGAYWWTGQPAGKPEPGLPVGMIVAGGVACAAALIAYLRQMSLGDVAEVALDLLSGLAQAVGAVLGAIWSFFLGLFGLD